ncbi:MAG TPA: DUF2264 domain-containing protein [Acidobacteriaceae bacterium]|nr:DUF2264 domain-containing protein [Acidobacteriaceae bacterium]
MDRRGFLHATTALGLFATVDGYASASPQNPAQSDRDFWLQSMLKIGDPVLRALSEGKLKERMPVEAPNRNVEERRQYTHLEAIGRLLTGMAPWLESASEAGPEAKLKAEYAELSRSAIRSATDPKSPDFLNFNKGSQPVVDAAFLSLAIVRAPTELWHKLDSKTQQNLIAALESSRVIRPGYSNWLLFSAMNEAALSLMGVWWDPMRVDYALRTMDTWYKGDGVYGDGPQFHFDYYNSFVIHPLLLNVLDVIGKSSNAWNSLKGEAQRRAVRYAAIQERLIAPDGSFPPTGRSLAYRFGAFHLLAEMALRRDLPQPVAPSQVRSGLTAVMRRMLDAPGTFDGKGWLTVGFYGHQPSIAESYISTGSCYLCSAAFLPLGLPSTDPFWSEPSKPWTSKKAWSGEQVTLDHALADRPEPARS